MRTEKKLLAFNRGVVSELGLARTDVERLQMSAEVQRNYVPRVLGSMMLRPGLEYQNTTLDNKKARYLSFQFSINDLALIELTDMKMRVKVADTILTRPSSAPAVDFGSNNTDFTANITGWDTSETEAGATAPAWNSGGYMELQGDGTASSIAKSSVTLSAGADCAIKIGLHFGPVEVAVGNSTDPEAYFSRQDLGRGVHSLALTVGSDPDVYVRFYNRKRYTVFVDYCRFDTGNADNELELDTPWAEADLPLVRSRDSQSGDVVYISCDGHQQRKLERRDNGSWSMVYYEPEDGPFRVQNTTPTTVSSSGLAGDVTLTASTDIFKESQVGGLFKMASQGQVVENVMSGIDALTEKWSDPIRVTGVGNARKFGVVVNDNGTGWAGGDRVHLQFAYSANGPWTDSDSGPWTGDTSFTKDDNQDNQIIYYRIGVKVADTITNTVTATLNYTSGSITGIARITGFTDAKNVSAVVLDPFGNTLGTPDWWEGAWSDRRGYPSAGCLHESRLFHAGRDKVWGSRSDDYETFNEEDTGDKETIGRTIGFGPRQSIHWLMPLAQLMMGTAENSAQVEPVTINANNPIAGRSSSFGEPLTPSNFNLRTSNARGIFLDRSEQRLFELAYSSDNSVQEDYASADLNLTTPDFNEIGIVHIEVQHKPDLRIHCVRADGSVGMLVFDRAESVICWIDIDTDGEVEDVVTQPGKVEDQVYYVVKRLVDGNTVRYHERWALESEARGGLMNKQADSFVTRTGGASTTLSGLDHLEGKALVVWGDGKDLSEYDSDGNHIGPVVSGGLITLSESASNVCAGLRYESLYIGNKLAQPEDDMGHGERRNIKLLALMLHKTHQKGLKYGPSPDRVYDLPMVEDGIVQDENRLWDHYDKDAIPFGGTWSPDSRITLKSEAPKPCTVLGVRASQELSQK